MAVAAVVTPTRRPRFRRAAEPPPFRLTDDDVVIVRVIARHRLIRSTHIASLVGRSLDRTNDRLMRLFHAGYVDRPRAQLDRFPISGTAPMIYALADHGARLLCEREGIMCRDAEWGRKNREAGRPFIEHQIEIVNFHVALERAARDRSDVQIVSAEEMNAAASRRPTRTGGAAFSLRAKLSHRGIVRESSVVPDLVFGLQLANGERRNFMVEIDRGTMPVKRSDPEQTSFEGKMRVYLAAHASKQHERQFGWKNFRVLTITTDQQRMQSMKEASRGCRVPCSPGTELFLFSTFDDLRADDPLAHEWRTGGGRNVRLL
ncbi:MAG: replication-relaxation family protein [Steroidobacteraceae bacterium]